MRSFTKFTNFFNAIASKFSLQKQNKSYSQIFNRCIICIHKLNVQKGALRIWILA